MFKIHLPHFMLNASIQMTFKQMFKYVPSNPVFFKILPGVVSLFEPISPTFYLIDVEKVKINKDFGGEWVSRKGKKIKDDKVVMYIHGGGFITCSPATHRIITSCLSKYTGRKVFSVGYEVAPGKRYPSQIEQCVDAYRYLLSKGYKGSDIAIAGDSAGGNLALTVTLKIIQDIPDQKPACVVAMSPWTDLTINGSSINYNKNNDKMIPAARMFECRAMYTGFVDEADYKKPLVSPAFADFTGYPPTLVHVGDTEVLLSDAKFLNKNAKAQGVDITLKIWKGAGHVFQMWAALSKDARKSLHEISTFMKKHW